MKKKTMKKKRRKRKNIVRRSEWRLCVLVSMSVCVVSIEGKS